MQRSNRLNLTIRLLRLAALLVMINWVAPMTQAASNRPDACWCWMQDRSGYDADFDTCVYCTLATDDVCGCGTDCTDPTGPWMGACYSISN